MWMRAAAADECPAGEAVELVVGGRIIALFHAENQFHALDGICPHQGGPLGKGRLSGCVVTCPWHGWQFDVRSGQHQASAALHHPTYPVKVEEGAIWIDLPPEG
jgi:nitrite reductase (NADH) small subunit